MTVHTCTGTVRFKTEEDIPAAPPQIVTFVAFPGGAVGSNRKYTLVPFMLNAPPEQLYSGPIVPLLGLQLFHGPLSVAAA